MASVIIHMAVTANVLKLYGDYQRLNGYLARKYTIPVELLKNINEMNYSRIRFFK